MSSWNSAKVNLFEAAEARAFNGYFRSARGGPPVRIETDDLRVRTGKRID